MRNTGHKAKIAPRVSHVPTLGYQPVGSTKPATPPPGGTGVAQLGNRAARRAAKRDSAQQSEG